MGTLSTPRLAPTALGSAEKCLEMGETQVLLFIGTFEKCLEMGETQFLLFIGTFEKCLEMGETQFLLFIGTFGRNGKIITFVTDRQLNHHHHHRIPPHRFGMH